VVEVKPSLPGSESYTILDNDLAEGQVACVSKCAIGLAAANSYSRASPSILAYRDSRISSESRKSGDHMVTDKENGGQPNFFKTATETHLQLSLWKLATL